MQTRVDAWLDPWQDPLGDGFQIIQAQFGLASGGLTGTGPGRGDPGGVPAAETDFIFATIGEELGLDFPIEDTVLPVVDFTPAPAISSFVFHEGEGFPRWEQDLLVGTLKARTLYRLRIRDGELVEEEKLLDSLARIRDVEMGFDGAVYLLLEHGRVGSLVRLVPVAPEEAVAAAH